MRASAVLLKNAVPLTVFSNQVLYPYEPEQGRIQRLVHTLYTKFYLSQAKSYFPDFIPKEFPKQAGKIYSEAYDQIKGKHRGELLSFMTPPLVEMVKSSMKHNKSLPFHVFKEFEISSSVHARVSSDSSENSPKVNFLHLTLKVTNKGTQDEQFVTFERRLDDKFRDSWRVCFIDDEAPAREHSAEGGGAGKERV